MRRLVLDDLLRDRLHNLESAIEICDSKGQTLGRVLPESTYQEMQDVWTTSLLQGLALRIRNLESKYGRAGRFGIQTILSVFLDSRYSAISELVGQVLACCDPVLPTAVFLTDKKVPMATGANVKLLGDILEVFTGELELLLQQVRHLEDHPEIAVSLVETTKDDPQGMYANAIRRLNELADSFDVEPEDREIFGDMGDILSRSLRKQVEMANQKKIPH